MPQLAKHLSPLFFASSGDFYHWLSQHAASSTELVVGFYKVGAGKPSLSWPESVDVALCFGWIDGVRKGIDEFSYQIRFTLRKSNSIWSAVNIAKFELLSAQGKMLPAGAAAYAHRTAKKSNVYAYEQAQAAQLSETEIIEFKKMGGAWQFLQSTPPSYRNVVLHWVVQAKKPETRSARFQKLLHACADGLRLR